MGAVSRPAFIAVHRPADHAALIFVRHILDREDVAYYVLNEEASRGAFSAIAAEELVVMVESREAARCAAILQEELGLGQ